MAKGQKAVTGPDYRGSHWPGAQSHGKRGKGPALLTGGPGGAPFPQSCKIGASHPPYRDTPLCRLKAAGDGEKALPCLQGGSGEAPFPSSYSGAGALTLLTGSALSPGSQSSVKSKKPKASKERPNPGYREVAQHKSTQGTMKVPTRLQGICTLEKPGMPFAQGVSRATS